MKMRVNSKVVAIVLLVVLFGGIGISKALGVWRTESTKIPAKYTSGEYAGQYNPEDIRGSFTLKDVTDSFDVPVEVLAQAFGIKSSNPANYAIKDLGTLYTGLEEKGTPIETASVRYFVALYKGLPITLTEETYLPKSAAELLKDRGKLTPEQIQYLESHTVDFQGVPSGGAGSASVSGSPQGDSIASSVEGSEADDQTLKGKTTFKEVLDWGLPASEIEEVLGGKLPSTGMAVRDYCVQKGLEFSTVKLKLQQKLEARK